MAKFQIMIKRKNEKKVSGIVFFWSQNSFNFVQN